MTTGQMRDRISLFRAKPNAGPFADVPVSPEELEFVSEVYAKREDKISPSFWGQGAENIRFPKQFIVRFRTEFTDGIIRIQHRDELLEVKAIAELGNLRQWLVFLAEKTENIGV